VGNSFQWSDNLTKVSGNHTLKFGVDFRRQQFNQFYYYNVNGSFAYYGGGPNDPVACSNYDPLRSNATVRISIPTIFWAFPIPMARFRSSGERPQHGPLPVRARQLEDQAESHAELRVSMGVKHPLADKAQHVETFRPGKCRRSSLAEAPIPIARRRMRSDWWFQATPAFPRA